MSGGRNDPYSPDYAPGYTGEQDDGDVGSGDELGADLYFLYAAGRVRLPDAAIAYSRLTSSLHALRPLVARCVETTPGSLDQLLTLCDDLETAFRASSNRIADAGEALVQIADDYVRTDEEAAASFNQWLTALGDPYERGRLDDPPVRVPPPPGPDDPYPEIDPSPHGPLPQPGEL